MLRSTPIRRPVATLLPASSRFALVLAALPVLVAPWLTPTPAASASSDRWLHIAVDGTAEDPERVRIHLPMKLVAALEPIVEKYGWGDGDFACKFNGTSFDRAQIVEILKAVSEAKDGELITIDDAEDHVRVTKEKNDLVIRVREQKDSTAKVDVRMPLTVARALASGKGDDLDLGAALEALSKVESSELVSVQDDGERVRIWIDAKNTSD